MPTSKIFLKVQNKYYEVPIRDDEGTDSAPKEPGVGAQHFVVNSFILTPRDSNLRDTFVLLRNVRKAETSQ